MKRLGTLFGFVVLFFFSTGLAAGEEIRVGGGAAPVNNVLAPIKEPFEKVSGIGLTIIEAGPKVALEDLLKGALDVAGAGVNMEEWMDMMDKAGVKVDRSGLQSFVVGKTAVRVIVNKGNTVTHLTKEQLKKIFTGAVTNWNEVGGQDMPIIVVWGKLIPGMNLIFSKKILDGAAVTKDVLEATNAPDIRQHVASNVEAVGIVSSGALDDTVKAPDMPETASEIIFAVKGEPSPKIRKLLDFIKGEGQKYIKK